MTERKIMKRVYANAFKHYDKIVYCQTIEGGHFKELLKSEKVDYIELPVLDQDVVYYKRGLKKEAYASYRKSNISILFSNLSTKSFVSYLLNISTKFELSIKNIP